MLFSTIVVVLWLGNLEVLAGLAGLTGLYFPYKKFGIILLFIHQSISDLINSLLLITNCITLIELCKEK